MAAELDAAADHHQPGGRRRRRGSVVGADDAVAAFVLGPVQGLVRIVDQLLERGGTVAGLAPAGADVAAERLHEHGDRKSTRLNSSHYCSYRLPSSACRKQQHTT